MDKRSVTSKENGKKGGRRNGSKNTLTIMKEMELEEFQKLARQRMDALFYSQLTLALGSMSLFRIDENSNGGREHVLVTDKNEIGDILSQMHGSKSEGGVYNDVYYYISTKDPDNSALNSILDRAYGRAQQRVDHTTKGEKLPTPILDVSSDHSTKKD